MGQDRRQRRRESVVVREFMREALGDWKMVLIYNCLSEAHQPIFLLQETQW